jgi:hypothetical protein
MNFSELSKNRRDRYATNFLVPLISLTLGVSHGSVGAGGSHGHTGRPWPAPRAGLRIGDGFPAGDFDGDVLPAGPDRRQRVVRRTTRQDEGFPAGDLS